MTDRIPPRHGTAFRLFRGETLRVVDPEGGQVSDLLAFMAGDVGECLSNGRTFDYEETIRLGVGNRLWSNRSNPMLEIIEDPVGCHDFLLTPCSEATFRHFYKDKPVHRGCFGNLAGIIFPPDCCTVSISLAMIDIPESIVARNRSSSALIVWRILLRDSTNSG